MDFDEAGGEAYEAGKRTKRRTKLCSDRPTVWSRHYREFTWRNSEALRGDLIEAVAALKEEPGSDIAISGSVSVVRQLLAADLLDELHLLIHPIVVGKGLRLFENSETLPLRLLSSTTFTTGVVHLVYRRAESFGSGGYEQATAHLRADA